MARRELLIVTVGMGIVAACVDVIGIKDVPDGATPAEASSDAATDASSRCDPAKPFGTSSAVSGLLSDGIEAFSITPDGRTVYICRTTPGSGAPVQLSLAQRANTTGPFTAEVPIATNQRICLVQVTHDGLTAAYSQSDPYDGSSLPPPQHVFMLTRTLSTVPFNFDAGKPLTQLNLGSEAPLGFRDDGSQLYFEEYENSVISLRASNADSGFTNVVTMTGLPQGAYAFHTSGDGLVVYFTYASSSLGKIQYATRSDVDQSFGSAMDTGIEFSGQQQFIPILISDDLCTLYYEDFEEVLVDGSLEEKTTLYVVNKTP